MAIAGVEYQLLSRYFSDVALTYLQTGEYPRTATFGGEFLTPNQRKVLDAFRGDPTAVSANVLSQFLKTGYTADDLQQTLETIQYQRAGQAGDVARAARQAAVPDPDVPPLGPLPANQEYKFDFRRNVWTVVENGTKFVTDVDQSGRPAPAAEPTPAPAPAPTGPATGGVPAGEAVYAAAEFGAGVSPYAAAELGQMQAGVEGYAPTLAPEKGAPSGKGGVSDVAEQPADLNIPEDWRNAAREMYPQYYAIVRNIPEIAQLLETAINESYTPEKFQAELEQTNWYLQTSGAAREWEINSQRDPASAQRKIDEQIVTIRDLALSSFGVRLSDERLSQLAEDSLRFGWSSRFLENAIGDVATTSTAGISQLREGYIGQQLRKTADDYGISVSDATFNQWVNKVAVGQESTTTFQDYARVQAKNLFPSISDRIDAGETFQQIIDPYRESAASLLEIDGGTIDFKQPDWIKAITYQDDKGQQRPMSFTEWNDYVRQNRSFGYEYTEQAQRRAYQVANSLANLFGKV